jgi:broad specificity phosphatase PhoE
MRTIYLLRHGETLWNTENRLQGHLDSPLTPRGIEQVKQNARILGSILKDQSFQLYSSPLGRTRETSRILAEHLNIDHSAIIFDDRLKEVCYGSWEGRTSQDIEINDADSHQQRMSDRWNIPAPGGESYSDVAMRLKSWLDGLDSHLAVVVSHGGTGKILRGLHAKLDTDLIHAQSNHHESIFVLNPDGSVSNVGQNMG